MTETTPSTSTTPIHRASVREWASLGVLTLAVVLLAIDGTVLALAVPSLTADLDPTAQAIILRLTSVPSGLATGALLGAITGAAAWLLSRRRRDPLPGR